MILRGAEACVRALLRAPGCRVLAVVCPRAVAEPYPWAGAALRELLRQLARRGQVEGTGVRLVLAAHGAGGGGRVELANGSQVEVLPGTRRHVLLARRPEFLWFVPSARQAPRDLVEDLLDRCTDVQRRPTLPGKAPRAGADDARAAGGGSKRARAPYRRR